MTQNPRTERVDQAPHNRNFLSKLKTAPKALALCFAMAALPAATFAQDAPQPPAPAATAGAETVRSLAPAEDIAQVTHVHIGYVMTASDRANATSEDGITALSEHLNRRTSTYTATPRAIDIENDDITLLPFIYWPITANDAPISTQARDRVQNYIDNGGIILFDLKDGSGLGDYSSLTNVVGSLRMSPLERLEEGHTLTRSFYLLSTLRGTYSYGDIWVEEDGPEGTESISNVIIGRNDWAAAWAGDTLPISHNSRISSPYELSVRAGVNLILYALTGNYKADQLHLDATLDRIGGSAPRP